MTQFFLCLIQFLIVFAFASANIHYGWSSNTGAAIIMGVGLAWLLTVGPLKLLLLFLNGPSRDSG